MTDSSAIQGDSSTDAVVRVQAIVNRVYSPYMLRTAAATRTRDAAEVEEWRPSSFYGGMQRCYLWSDAFGVCTFLALYYATSQRKFLLQAKALVRDVHADLGFERGSHTKRLSARATADAPLLGGLRIGKPQAHEDGQYFHYLTKWMFALCRLSVAAEDAMFLEWAIQLATVAHRHFVLLDAAETPVRMVWKRSTDLERVMVAGEGGLEFDGLVTFRLLQRAKGEASEPGSRPVLEREVADMQRLVDRRVLTLTLSDDALDLGQALWLASWFPGKRWARRLASVALAGLERLAPHVFPTSELSEFHAGYRLLFREMGAALGLQVAVVADAQADAQADAHAALLTGVTKQQRELWAERVRSLLELWRPHIYDRDRDVSPLMYAAALLPSVWSPQFKP